jgi:hypothetical protein
MLAFGIMWTQMQMFIFIIFYRQRSDTFFLQLKIEDYQDKLEEMKNMSRQETIVIVHN